MTDLTWGAAELDNADAEDGVVHESVANTDNDDASVLKQGYSAASPLFSSDLVAYWPLQEDTGTTVTDVAGSNDGTNNGATVNQTGLLGASGYDFDGTDDYLSLVDLFTETISSSYTLSFWVNLEDLNLRMFDTDNGFADRSLLFDANTDGDFVFTQYDNTDSSQPTVGGTASTTAGWAFVAGTWDGSEITLYVDSSSVDTTPISTIQDSSTPLNFGRRTGVNDKFFDGRAADLRLYSRALSSSEIQTLYDVVKTSGSLTTASKTV